MLYSVVIGSEEEGYDLTSVTHPIRGEGVIPTVPICYIFFHRPAHGLGIIRILVYIGEVAGLFRLGLIKGVPDIADSGGAGAGRTAVKAIINHTFIPRPAYGFVHVLGGGRALASICSVEEGQNLGLCAVLAGGEGGGAGAVSDVFHYSISYWRGVVGQQTR